MTRRLWTREEFILALNLYLKIPFGKMHSRNPEIQELARLIGRTDNSVALRLVNFAACDPELQARGIKGMWAGREQCMPYWEEFENNKEELLFESEKVLASFQNKTVEAKYSKIIGDVGNLRGEEKVREIKTRVNQNFFRQMLLGIYDNKCALTGIEQSDLLLASHIIPWKDNEKERLNPRNGICLSALYDRAFDKGLISFDNKYRVILSVRLKEYSTRDYYHTYFGSLEGKALSVPFVEYSPDSRFLEYHREVILQR